MDSYNKEAKMMKTLYDRAFIDVMSSLKLKSAYADVPTVGSDELANLVLVQFMNLREQDMLSKLFDGVAYRNSPWNKYFSSDQISLAIVENFDASIDTFEIGSGSGYMASVHNNIGRSPKLICVDPFPGKFGRGHVYQKPTYPTVDDLIAKVPKVTSTPVQLVFVWPVPEGADETFAEDALRRLGNVVRVLVVYVPDGASGTDAFRGKLFRDFDEKVLAEAWGGEYNSLLFQISFFTKKETADGWTVVKKKQKKTRK